MMRSPQLLKTERVRAFLGVGGEPRARKANWLTGDLDGYHCRNGRIRKSQDERKKHVSPQLNSTNDERKDDCSLTGLQKSFIWYMTNATL